jgi:hypothetical protein
VSSSTLTKRNWFPSPDDAGHISCTKFISQYSQAVLQRHHTLKIMAVPLSLHEPGHTLL